MDKPIGKMIQSVQRAIDILNCFTSGGEGISLSELSKKLSLNKSTVYGIVNTLRNNQYLTQGDDGKYFLGIAILNKSINQQQPMNLLWRDIAHTQMKLLADKFESGAKLFLFADGIPYCIHQVFPTTSKYVLNSEFEKAPLYCTASGKLALSVMDESELEDYISHNPLLPMSSYSIVSKKELLENLIVIRATGYSKESQELSEGVSALSVPIFYDNNLSGTISLTSTSYYIDKFERAIIEDLKRNADIIISKLSVWFKFRM